MRVVVKGITYRSTEAGLYYFKVIDRHGKCLGCMCEQEDNRVSLDTIQAGDSLSIKEVVNGFSIYRIEERNGVAVFFDWLGEGF